MLLWIKKHLKKPKPISIKCVFMLTISVIYTNIKHYFWNCPHVCVSLYLYIHVCVVWSCGYACENGKKIFKYSIIMLVKRNILDFPLMELLFNWNAFFSKSVWCSTLHTYLQITSTFCIFTQFCVCFFCYIYTHMVISQHV